MPSEIETSAWSGEGAFTQVLIDHLREMESISLVRVEDAPATRSDADYMFISNELFIAFATIAREAPTRRFGILPGTRTVTGRAMTIASLAAALTATAGVGAPDYGDEGMLQYLRSERIIPPYQTRGYKLVELVRVYEAGAPRRD